MRLLDCRRRPNRRPPKRAVYIGREMAGYRRGATWIPALGCSPLRNPFKCKGDQGAAIALEGAKPHDLIERFRRHLTWRLAFGFDQPLRGLRELEQGSTLACWCVDRPARVLHGEIVEAPDHCHGDVVFTVYLALVELGWVFAKGDPLADHKAFSAAHAELYQACFKQPLVWKVNR